MLRVIPLGGLGEVGLNTMVLEHGGERLLVDCGLMFPRENQPGAEIVLPDFTYLRDSPNALKGIVLTHAHEDHLGALPYFLRELPVPVYGTPFTLALAKYRLDEAGMTADLREIGPRSEFTVGESFRVEPVRVTHSIPDCVGLIVRTPSGTLVHSGDFKLDGMPIDGQLTDLQRLGEIGDEGVTVLLSDSTNAEVPGLAGSERVVNETFDRLFSKANGRIFVAMFGSHVHRVRHALDLAVKHGRRVLLAGRSLVRNVELAKQVQLLTVPEGLLVPWEAAQQVLPSKLLVLCTGAQAEPRSALSSLLGAEPGPLRVERGDTVILSARTIPGNEPGVSDLLNRLFLRGAHVVYPAIEPGVHVSGHAAQEEQKQLLSTVRPKNFVPIHGALRHLHRHRHLASELGMSDERLFVMADGDVVGFSEERGSALGRVPSGRLLMRRDGLTPITEPTLQERRGIAENGIVIIVVVMQLGSGKVLSGPTAHGQGLNPDEQAALSLAAEGARLALSEVSAAVRGDDERVREELFKGVRRVFKQLLGVRPTVMPVVLRL